MKRTVKILVLLLILSIQVSAQSSNAKTLEKRYTSPWAWQEKLSYVQAVEVKNAQSTLYVSGQAAVHPDGTASNENMRTQLALAIKNLETVIRESGFECRNIVKLTIYTTSSKEFTTKCFDLFQEFVAKHGMKQTVTLMQVVALNETLNIELEATVVK